MARRVAVVAAFHETNTFSPQPTDLAAFRAKRWLQGGALFDAFARTGTVVGGFLDGAGPHELDCVPGFGAYATPAGRVTRSALDAIRQELITALRGAEPFDGVLFELHGAMVAEGLDDPENALCEAVREVAGDRPVVAVTDLHANLSAARLERLDMLVGYRTNPHVDTHARGVDAAGHLAAILDGSLRPAVAHRHVPVIAAPPAQRTDTEPLAGLLAAAAEQAAREEVVDATVHAGYAYADVPHLGMGVTVTARDDAAAGEAADALAALAWRSRRAFSTAWPSAADAYAEAAAAADGQGPVAVADTGDNINGGAPGDATWLLREALAGPAVRCLATIWDPALLERAAAAGAGARITAQAGGRSTPASGDPLPLDARVRWVGDGTFTATGPMHTGAVLSMGRAAVLTAGHLDLVVQERAVQPNDPDLFRCCGLDPAAYDVALLKGAAAIRAGWAPVARRFVEAGTPGVTDCRLERLPYRRVSRPLWPLDDVSPSGGEPLDGGRPGRERLTSGLRPEPGAAR